MLRILNVHSISIGTINKNVVSYFVLNVVTNVCKRDSATGYGMIIRSLGQLHISASNPDVTLDVDAL